MASAPISASTEHAETHAARAREASAAAATFGLLRTRDEPGPPGPRLQLRGRARSPGQVGAGPRADPRTCRAAGLEGRVAVPGPARSPSGHRRRRGGPPAVPVPPARARAPRPREVRTDVDLRRADAPAPSASGAGPARRRRADPRARA